jgi:hypothetical protein
MNRSRLGCLTPTGITAGLLTLAFIIVSAVTRGGTLYTPGPLNAQAGEVVGGVTSHAATGGDCGACHTAPWSVLTMADRCATCHTDVAADMKLAASLHGTITEKNPNLKCAHCHPEHRGASAPLTIAGGADFPHDALGYSLAGHQKNVTGEAFTCADCHTQGISNFDPQVCEACHQQIDVTFAQAHLINYGADCLACHDGVDNFGSAFTHSNFIFHLDGKHAQVNCVSCHLNARALADFASAPQDCTTCHLKDDAHQSRFGSDCGACHSVAGWKPANFDHSRSGFPLDGAHQNVKCADCHLNDQFSGLSTACSSCHADPVFHAGAFGAQCESCHSTSAWSPAKYNGPHPMVADEGGSGVNHGGASCKTCHPADVYSYTCLSCHNSNSGQGGGD